MFTKLGKLEENELIIVMDFISIIGNLHEADQQKCVKFFELLERRIDLTQLNKTGGKNGNTRQA